MDPVREAIEAAVVRTGLTRPPPLGGGQVRYSDLVLNEDVIRALLEDEQLALVYLTLHPGYDAEIEPLHRPSWVLAQAKLEEEWLAEARRKLARARAALEVLV